MKKIALSFIVVFLLSFATFAQEEWHTFSSQTGNFSIEFIGDVNQSINKSGKADSFKVTFNSNDMSYMVSSTKHVSDLEEIIDDLLLVSLDEFNKSVKGNIEIQKDVSLGNSKGIYALITMMEGAVKLEYYVYMKGMYQYQIVSYAIIENYSQEGANRFVNSFKVLE